MRCPRTILAAAVLPGLLLACGPRSSGPAATSQGWAAWRHADNAYADRFQVWQRGDDRFLLVFGHGGPQDTVGRYWISEDATAPPPVAAVRFDPRLKEVATGSTTHVPYLAALGSLNAIIACAHVGQVRDTAFAGCVRQGRVREIAMGEGLDREALIAMRPQALFGYPFGRGDAGVLERAGIPVIEVSEYLEEHPLGRAEWLRFFGVLFGREREADSLFAGIRQRYESVRVENTEGDRASVLFGSVWNGQWWVPPGNSYMARLIADAGGRYVFADRTGNGNIAVDMETMITVGAQADTWGMIANVDGEPSVRDFTGGDARLAEFKAVKEGRLFMANAANEDIFGQALIEPDEVLMTLQENVHPGLVVDHPSGYRPKYFAGMYKEVVPPRIRMERFVVPQ